MGLLGDGYIVKGNIQFEDKDLLSLSKTQLRGIYGKEICYIMQNPMTAFNPSIRIGAQLCNTYLCHQSGHEKTVVADEILVMQKSVLTEQVAFSGDLTVFADEYSQILLEASGLTQSISVSK